MAEVVFWNTLLGYNNWIHEDATTNAMMTKLNVMAWLLTTWNLCVSENILERAIVSVIFPTWWLLNQRIH